MAIRRGNPNRLQPGHRSSELGDWHHLPPSSIHVPDVPKPTKEAQPPPARLVGTRGFFVKQGAHQIPEVARRLLG